MPDALLLFWAGWLLVGLARGWLRPRDGQGCPCAACRGAGER